jgi:conserved oligomeric Golgi complex subunit 5
VNPLLVAIKKDLSAIIARLHRLDLGQDSDTGGGMGGGPSLYMKDLVDRLNFIKTEVLGNFSVGESSKEWFVSSLFAWIRD